MDQPDHPSPILKFIFKSNFLSHAWSQIIVPAKPK